MLFEMLLEWLVGKAADAVVEGLSTSDAFKKLTKDLDAELTNWEKANQKEFPGFYSQPLLESITSQPRVESPALGELMNQFLEGQVATADIWLPVLIEQRKRVYATHGMESQSFYLPSSDGEAVGQLKALAEQLEQTCARNPDFFRTSVHLFQTQANKQLKQIANQLDEVKLLFGSASQQDLAKVLRHLRNIDKMLRRKERLSPSLTNTLESVEGECRAEDRQVYTSDILLALLAASPTGNYVDEAAEGLCQMLVTDLQTFNASLTDTAKFVPVDWEQHKDVVQAARESNDDESPRINHKHFLLAILKGESNTIRGLRARLGDDERFTALVQAIELSPSDWHEPQPTPSSHE